MQAYDWFAIQTRLLAELISPSWGEMNHLNGIWSLEFDTEVEAPFILQFYLTETALRYRVSALFVISDAATQEEGQKWAHLMSADRTLEEGEISSYQHLDRLLSPEAAPLEAWEHLARQWFERQGFSDEDIWIGYEVVTEENEEVE